MTKVALSIKIDVTKIDKSRLFKGEKGTYLDLTTFVDLDTKDQYDNNGFISQSVSKDEKAAGLQTPILGNCRVFWTDKPSDPVQASAPVATPVDGAPSVAVDDDSIPF